MQSEQAIKPAGMRSETAVEAPAEVEDWTLRTLEGMRRGLNSALLGKPEVVELTLCCVLGRGHLLLEDKPGLGKTTLAKAVAEAIGGTFARVQCTPDLLPADLTGFSVFNQETRAFEFMSGPVFCDVLLADELNRTTPRTQSALLEAMAERQVTVDNVRRTLPEGFMVIATQNPAEHLGTYALPVAQLDRFAIRLSIGAPSEEAERQMLAQAVGALNADASRAPIEPLPRGGLERLQKQAADVFVHERIRGYLIALAGAFRSERELDQGLSPRAVLTWQRLSQAWALLQGRTFVLPEDVQATARPTLIVRLGLSEARALEMIADVLESVEAPID